MRCSSSEADLDAFALGALGARDRTRVEAHVASCGSCAELLAEIRVIDALLVSPPAVELPPNFSFKVMAEVRSLPRPHVTRTPLARVLLAYLVFAWIAIAAFFATGGAAARDGLSLVRGALGDSASVFETLSVAIGRLCDHDPFGVGATMSAVLALDAAVTIAAIAAYGALLGRSGRRRESGGS